MNHDPSNEPWRAVVAISLPLERALIFRITHVSNLPWILGNGLHCRNSNTFDPNFISIGNQEIIDKRHNSVVKIKPYGTLSDYIPFYFTPKSMMAYNIKTGYNGVTKRNSKDIIIMASSLVGLNARGLNFVFTNKHALNIDAKFYSSIDDLNVIDWDILRRCDFSRDNDDLDKTSRYQAEALVHKHVPLDALAGIACYDSEQKEHIEFAANKKGCTIKVVVKREWYF
jgi:hypothetical protein